MRLNRLSARIANAAGLRHLELLALADRAADAVDAQVVRAWRQLIQRLTEPQARRFAQQSVHELFVAVAAALRGHLVAAGKWGHAQTVRLVRRHIPQRIIRLAIYRPERLREDVRPALLTFAGWGAFTAPEPAEDLDRRERLQQLLDLLFPPPSEASILQVLRNPLHGSTWEQDLQWATRLAQPEALAATIATSFSLGKTPAQIARDLLPIVQSVKSSARRIARTYSAQAANHMQQEAWQGLGDMLVGYMVHAQLDQHTRPWHAARNGTIYYLEPKEGQKGPAQQPHPPLEAEDARERPVGTPRTAFN